MKLGARPFASVLLLLASLGSGCSTKKASPTRNQVVGTYAATFDGNTEILVIKSDGTYQLQRNAGEDGQVLASSEWSLVPYGNETKIALNGFPNPLNNADQGATSVTLLGVEDKRTELRLYLSYDRDWYYSKAR